LAQRPSFWMSGSLVANREKPQRPQKNPWQDWLSARGGPSYPSLSGASRHISTACPRGQNPPSRKRDAPRSATSDRAAKYVCREGEAPGRLRARDAERRTHPWAGRTLRREKSHERWRDEIPPRLRSPRSVPDTAHRHTKTSATNDTQRTVIIVVRASRLL
jgi:hypothetical protein